MNPKHIASLCVGFVVVACLLVGCGTVQPSSKLSKIQLGMTKAEVIAALGTPSTVRASGGVEFLTYMMEMVPGHYGTYGIELRSPVNGEFFVRLIQGKVESFGRLGDFDSTKIPESKQTIDLNVNPKK